MCTTLVAVSLAISFSSLLQIDIRANLSAPHTTLNISQPNTFSETLVRLFTGNPIRSLAEGNLLQVIIFAVLLGIAIRLAGKDGARIKVFFQRHQCRFNAVGHYGDCTHTLWRLCLNRQTGHDHRPT